MSELLPCPFCGEKPKDGELVWCENRRCAFFKLSPLLRDHWNTRASSASQDKVVEGLRVLLEFIAAENSCGYDCEAGRCSHPEITEKVIAALARLTAAPEGKPWISGSCPDKCGHDDSSWCDIPPSPGKGE